MKRLDELRKIVSKGTFPKDYPEFAGANLIITSDTKRNYHEADTFVYSENAAALSWLVFELKKIYDSKLDHLSKYDFYPQIGSIINKSLVNEGLIFDTMLNVIDEIEDDWS